MTAEIGILNKHAVVLAADSAVTISAAGQTGRKKVYTTVNKLFALSKYEPVGIMVYASANFMGVPWETLIKAYRKELNTKTFDKLEGYAFDFFDFLSKNIFLFSQESYVKGKLFSFYNFIKKDINEVVSEKLKHEPLTNTIISQIAHERIKELYSRYSKSSDLPCFPVSFSTSFFSTYSSEILRLQNVVFDKLPLVSSSKKLLKTLSLYIFMKDIFTRYSGVVFAGFGVNEFYPALISYHVDGFAEGTLRHKQIIYASVTDQSDGHIYPFAQAYDMVHSFMEGINESVLNYVNQFMGRLFDDYPNILIEALGVNKETVSEENYKNANKITQDFLARFFSEFTDFRRRTQWHPIVDSVSFLPKEELAIMAETLVNLTLFKQKISVDEDETVSGAIDVAIISKGDGFIWIKRKHYFDPKLNPSFFNNLNRTEDE